MNQDNPHTHRHPLNLVSNISERASPNMLACWLLWGISQTDRHTKFPLLGLLSEPKYCVLLQDKGSCALKRRAGSGRWYTHWQVLMDIETTPIFWLLSLCHSQSTSRLFIFQTPKIWPKSMYKAHTPTPDNPNFFTMENIKVTLAINVILIFCHQGVVYQIE